MLLHFEEPTVFLPSLRKVETTGLIFVVLCLHRLFSLSVFAKQELQPLCRHLFLAGGAPEVTQEQLSCGAEARRPPAEAQHHRRADSCQGNAGLSELVLFTRLTYCHPEGKRVRVSLRSSLWQVSALIIH